MLLALLLLATPRVELGSVSGVSSGDAQAVLQEVRSAAGSNELFIRVQVIGGVTRVLLVLELMAAREVDARAECSATPGRISEAKSCIREALNRFVARRRPQEVAPTPTAVAEADERFAIRAATYSLVGVSGALAIAGAVLASYASSSHRELGTRPFADDRFRELEQQERTFGISAGVVLGVAVVSLAASLLLAVLE